MREGKKTTPLTEKASGETLHEIPLFLRKTYHMIDSCDPTVACWSEDGETFVVKDPTKFETVIIPQFFKHSKFTSFVRQLNFYSFRKIKYVDTIRLDPKLEAETANYWRFRHDKFQRGKPKLLSEIKRMNGPKTSGAAASNKKVALINGGENPTEMKQELDSLKKRIEEMNKNMSKLTFMVQKVALKPTAPSMTNEDPPLDVPPGAKRKKVDVAIPKSVASSGVAVTDASQPPTLGSSDPESLMQPDEMLSASLLFEEILPMLTDDPVHLESLEDSDCAENSADKVFAAFSPDDALIDICCHSVETMDDTTATHLLPDASTGLAPVQASPKPTEWRTDRADPELMGRLSEALAVLPKEMQEQIVERLIAAITTTNIFAPSSARQEPDGGSIKQATSSALQAEQEAAEVGMPLAAATLAALLSHYSARIKNFGNDTKENAARSGVKAIPVIPVHA